MGRPRVTLRPTPPNPEDARAARVRGWFYAFQCWQDKQKNVEPAPEPDVRDGTLVQGDDSADEQIIPEHP